MRMWRIVLLALGGVRRSRLRVSLTTLGVAVASGALVTMVAFALGIQEQVETPFKTLGLMNVIRVSAKRGKDADGAPVLDDDALTKMESLSGVEIAYADFRVSGVKISRGEKTATVVAVGTPRQMALPEAVDEILIAGDYLTPGDSPEIIIARGVARDLGFDALEDAIGATVTVKVSGLSPGDAATFTFERKDLEVTIVGVYDLSSRLPGPMSRVVLLPIDLMKQIPGTRIRSALPGLRAGRDAANAGYSRATVRVHRHSDLPPVEKAIRAMGFDARSMLSRLDEMQTFFVFIDVLLAAVGTVALVVAGLGIINTLLIAVLERRQEIGICKAIGASDGDLVVLFLTEAGIIGLMGGLGGLVMGRAVAWALEIAANAYARSEGVMGHLDIFAFPLWLLAATVLFAMVISVLAGVYPARRAARVDPIQALRRE